MISKKRKALPQRPQKVVSSSIETRNRELSNHCPDLELKQSTLVDVVQSLGEYINDEDLNVRSRAVEYLSDVIGTLSTDFLTRQQAQVLCKFFCDRIEDGGAVVGLQQLQANKRYNKEMAEMTFRA